ncbi:MAG: sodium-independent anion transporter [Flavobacteriales bacterium]|nr:sodium-independent anion transporter [Flavobacteriales bacterium]|tara:strand:- start:8812 stop:10416 length:1605 start_codon:yes stop_codon:yes gene_type:complete
MVQWIKKSSGNLKDDALSGITVALALVPEAIAFSFIAKIDPIVGLYGAFMVGLITAIFGGRPGMISGATGALAVVMVKLIQAVPDHAPSGMENPALQYLFATLILMGVIQVIFGAVKLGKLVRLIPHPVMMGFVNGLAIVICYAQFGMLKTKDGDWLPYSEMIPMVLLIALTMVIMWLLPKLTKAIPAGLVAIVVVTSIVAFGGIETETVLSFLQSEDPAATLKGVLPTFNVPFTGHFDTLFSWETLWFIGPYAFILAAVGLIESLMTLQLVDEITETKGSGNRESLGQGLANIVNGFFGGMGGCAMIGQSMINVTSGGRGRASGIIAALGLLSFILWLSDLIEIIPIAALVGVMFMVVIGTFAWKSFKTLVTVPKTDAFVIVLVTTITVIQDLAVAVISGIIVSALMFAWENAKRIRARKSFKEDGTKVYEIWGPLFFGSITAFSEKFDVQNDPERIEIDFIESKVSDHSGIEALEVLITKYQKAGKKIKLTHLSQDCKDILLKANPVLTEVIENNIDDPRYFVLSEVNSVDS